MTTIEITKKQANVLDYLKNMKKYCPLYYEHLRTFGVAPNDIIKVIENPDACGRWKFDYVGMVFQAIDKIDKYYLIPFPEIEKQTEEDRVISNILRKNSYYCFGTNTFFDELVKVNHIIDYMERNKVIYEWNAHFVLCVQQEVKRVKEFLL